MNRASANVERLERRLSADWSNLRAARVRAAETRETLRRALREFDSEDTSIVVSGSLARDEFTEGSDIDWTLLIDGQANSAHHDLALKARRIINRIADYGVF